MRRLAAFCLFLVLALPAAAQTAADLGPAATTGQAAHDGFAERTQRLHLVITEPGQGHVVVAHLAKQGREGVGVPVTVDAVEREVELLFL